MSISNYIRPQLLIRQLLDRSKPLDAKTRSAMVMGPQYDLFRYTNTTERAAMHGVLFEANSDSTAYQTVPYEGLLDTHIVDQLFAKLYGENIEGELWSLANNDTTYNAQLLDLGDPNRIHILHKPATIPSSGVTLSDGELLTVVPDQGGGGYDPDNGPVVVITPVGSGATAGAVTLDSEQIVDIAVATGGSGYDNTNHPVVLITGGGGSGATAHVTVASGVITGIVVDASGTGYTTSPTVTITSGSGATATASVSANGVITSINVTAGGANYTSKPTITLATAPKYGANVGSTTKQFTEALLPSLHGRPLRKGDAIYTTFNGVTSRRIIKSVDQEVTPSRNDAVFSAAATNFGATTASSNGEDIVQPRDANIQVSGDMNCSQTGASYSGKLGDRYTFTVTRGGTISQVLFKVRSASGLTSYDNLPMTFNPDSGNYEMWTSGVAGWPQASTLNITGFASTFLEGDAYTFTFYEVSIPLVIPDGLQVTTPSGAYLGSKDTTYYITVTKGNAKSNSSEAMTSASIRITDSAGIDRSIEIANVAQDTVYSLGTLGIQFKFPSYGIAQYTRATTGDIYVLHAYAAVANGPSSVITLNGQPVDITGWTDNSVTANNLALEVRTVFTGAIPQQGDLGIWSWYAGDKAEGGILVPYNLSLFVADRATDHQWVLVKNSTNGRLFASWRGLVPAGASETAGYYNSPAALDAAFGTSDPDNHLRYAAGLALAGAQGKAIYAMRVSSNDVPGWTAALKKAARLEGPYAIAPLTHDQTILGLVENHVNACSTDSAKLWRRAYFPNKNPGRYAHITTTADTNDTLLGTITTTGGKNVRVLAAGANFITNGIVAGDLVRLNFGVSPWETTTVHDKVVVTAPGNTYDEYVVAEVLEEDELRLVSGPSSPVSNTTRMEIWKEDTGLSQAAFVGNVAENWADRRIASIWCDNPYRLDSVTGAVVPIDLFYLCAEIAGLRTALYPQQGLTNTQVLCATHAPNMFTKYSEDELNLAASKGVMIVAQDSSADSLYIRHQLTTDTSSGSLYYEDSVGANFDNIAYDQKAILAPYVGKRNAVASAIEEIKTKMTAYFNAAKAAPNGDDTIGPAVIAWNSLVVQLDPNFKDRINTSITTELPLPINNIIETLNATTASNETIAAIDAAVAATA